MPHRFQRSFFSIALTCVGLGVYGCGGGGDSAVSADDRSQVPLTSGLSPSLNIDEEGQGGGDGGGDGGVGGGGIGAGGSLGKFSSAEISVVLDTGEELGRALVGTDGMVTLYPPLGYKGSMSFSVIGSATSTYFDEAKLANLASGSGVVLQAAVPRAINAVGITPLTHAAVRNLETRVARGLDASVDDPSAIQDANARMLAEINRLLPTTNQLTDITIVPTLVGSEAELRSLPAGARGNYAKAIAAFAVQAAKFNPSLANPGLRFAENLATDMTDGRIDDKDIDGNPLSASRDDLAYETPTLAAGLAEAISGLKVVTATIRDNGSLADDAFSVALDGVVVCTTTIGAQNSCELGQLAPGTYELAITATIAPDDTGTFEIQITSPNMTIDGRTSVTGSLREGASMSFELVVT